VGERLAATEGEGVALGGAEVMGDHELAVVVREHGVFAARLDPDEVHLAADHPPVSLRRLPLLGELVPERRDDGRARPVHDVGVESALRSVVLQGHGAEPERETTLQVLAETKPHDVATTLPESLGATPGKLLELVFYATQNVAVDACAVVPLADELPPPPPAPWQPEDASDAGLARLSLHEPALDGGDRADDSPVVRGQKAHEGDHQQAGVQLAPPEILYEGAKLCVEAARARRRVDLGANPAPVLHRALEAEVFDAAHGAVEREPRHHLRVREMPPRTADLPDPLVRSVPVVNHEIDERPLELPGRLLGRDSRRLRQVQSGHDLTVDVELELLRCGVADPDRARAGVPGSQGSSASGTRRPGTGSGAEEPFEWFGRTGSGVWNHRDGSEDRIR
jgi:hypothetical protein